MSCYQQGDLLPENGWLVVCHALGRSAHITSIDALVIMVRDIEEEAKTKWPFRNTPIQVFELGREMRVSVDYAVRSIRPL